MFAGASQWCSSRAAPFDCMLCRLTCSAHAQNCEVCGQPGPIAYSIIEYILQFAARLSGGSPTPYQGPLAISCFFAASAAARSIDDGAAPIRAALRVLRAPTMRASRKRMCCPHMLARCARRRSQPCVHRAGLFAGQDKRVASACERLILYLWRSATC